ncbi:MAG: cytochrome P450 [Anaerolineae bacterium]|nr:cytochrome P450 [Anaerolineae bacterium]
MVGHLGEIRQVGFLAFYERLWRDYGDLVQFAPGPLNGCMAVHPDQVRYILVEKPEIYIKGMSHDRLRDSIGHGILTLEGSDWRQQRRLLQPTYTPGGIRQFASIMTDEAEAAIARWRSTAGQPVDINEAMTRITMRVISRAIFGIDLDEGFREVALALHGLLDYTSTGSSSLFVMPLFLPTPANQRLKRNQKIVRDFIFQIIERRRRQGPGEDLLSLLMSIIDEDTGQPMTDDQLHDEILITFFAGHETTASLLTWTWYLLAQNPAVEARLYDEVTQVLAGRAPTLEDLGRLTYTRMVLEETLRLYPPVPLLARDAAQDDTLAGYPIKAGTLVVTPLFLTQRHPDYWERPEAFYPEHFTPEQVEQRPRYAYLPFGAGQRVCLGIHFARMEAAILLAHLAQHYRLRLAQPFDGRTQFVGVIRPAGPILMQVEAR